MSDYPNVLQHFAITAIFLILLLTKIKNLLFQGINLTSFKLNTYKVYRDLTILKHNKQFNDAIFLHPINTVDDFYLLHIYFSRVS